MGCQMSRVPLQCSKVGGTHRAGRQHDSHLQSASFLGKAACPETLKQGAAAQERLLQHLQFSHQG